MLGSLLVKVKARISILLARFNRPAKMPRTPEETLKLAKETSGLSLYDYKWCSSSLKTRHEIHHLNIDIERRDIQNCPIHQDNLLAQFGQLKAPCLRIEENGEVKWIDEPDQIIHYLHDRFGETTETVSV